MGERQSCFSPILVFINKLSNHSDYFSAILSFILSHFCHVKRNMSASFVSFSLGTRFVIKDSVNVAARFPMMHIFGRLQETMIHEINNIINNDKNKKRYNYGKSNWN